MAYNTDGKIGVTLALIHDTAQFPVGERTTTTDGGVAIYCKFTTAANIYDFVSIDEDFNAAPLSTSNDDDANFFGVVQVAVTVNYYAWVYIAGANLIGNLAGVTDIAVASPLAACAAGSGTGYLQIYTSTSQLKIVGVISQAVASGSTSQEVLLNFPNIVLT